MKIKKLKKLIAGVLSAAMVMSTMAVTAFAAGDTINTNTAVSLTIHKYRMEDTSQATTPGTGSSSDNIPSGAGLLDGVTFNVYRVADIEQAVDEDGNIQLQYKTVNSISGTVGDYIDSSTNVESIVNAVTTAQLQFVSKVTGAGSQGTGLAEFSNSELLNLDTKTTGKTAQGLYLVVEGDAPDVVTEKAAPFLVSLPMTAEENSNSEWIYDVHAFPKNGTMTSAITLRKLGKVGNGEATAVGDAKFVLQKMIDEAWQTITATDEGDIEDGIGEDGVFTVPANGKQITGLSQGTYRFIEVSAPDENYIMDGSATYEFTIDSDGTVSGADVSNSAITVTNNKPTIDKEVARKADNTQYGEAADYSTGDHVPFKVTATVPSNIDKLKHFVLTDNMSEGLSMDDADKASFDITYKDADGTDVSNSGITTQPSVGENNRSWTLDLSNYVSTLKTNNIASIEITFTATLTSDAVTAGKGNPNTVGLEYTNKIYPTSDPKNPNTPGENGPYEETKTITDKVTVYTFGLELNKSFEGEETIPKGFTATFDLYRNFVTDVDSDSDKKQITVGGQSTDVVLVGTYTTDAQGKITLNTKQTDGAKKGFSNGTYYFVETDTAEGYNLLKDPVEVELEVYYTQTFQTTTTTTKYNADGRVIDTSSTSTGEDTTTFFKDSDYNNQYDQIPVGSVSVVNKKGFSLPVTGGTGTLLASLIGILLMGGGAFVFISSRKKKKAE